MGGSLSKQSPGKVCGETVTQRKVIVWKLVSGIIPGAHQRSFTYYEKRCSVDINPLEDISHLMLVEPELCSRQVMDTVNADLETSWDEGWQCEGLVYLIPNGQDYCMIRHGRKVENPTVLYSREVTCKCGGKEHPPPVP